MVMFYEDITPDPNQPHPLELIEPEEDSSDAELVEKLTQILDWFLPQKPHLSKKLRAGYTKFVAAAWLLRPDLFGGVSQIEVAKQLGISSAAISKYAVRISKELGGFRNGAMRSDHFRAVQHQRLKGQPSSKNKTGAPNSVELHEQAVLRAVLKAREHYRKNKPLTTFQRQSLRQVGMLSPDGQLTAKGNRWFFSEV
jgi:hypothetical protein